MIFTYIDTQMIIWFDLILRCFLQVGDSPWQNDSGMAVHSKQPQFVAPLNLAKLNDPILNTLGLTVSPLFSEN